MTPTIAARFFVSGKVQGVFFRASTAHEAGRLNVKGHALNLSDGRVEVLAVGQSKDIDALEHWLGQGPPGARVDQIERESVDLAVAELPSDFITG